jgi:hypothetical protein
VVEVGRKTPGVSGVADISKAGIGVQVGGKVKGVAVLVGTLRGAGKVGGLNGLRAEYGSVNIARKITTNSRAPSKARMDRTSQIEIFMLSTRP